MRIGEKLGSLEQILKQLSRYLNDDKKLKDKLLGSLLYPMLVLGVAILGVTAIVLVVFPRMKAMLTAFSQGSAARVDALVGSISVSFIVCGAFIVAIVAAVIVVLAVRRRDGAPGRAVDSPSRLPLVDRPS